MLWFVAPAASAHVPVIWIAGPTDDWCAVANGAMGNDLIMLLPGEYRGPCVLVANPSDVPSEVTVLQSFDPVSPAVFVGSDTDVVLDVSGKRLELLLLTFRGLPSGVDAVRGHDLDELHVWANTFEDLPGTAVRQTGRIDELRVDDNRVARVGVGADLACGAAGCAAPAVRIEDNWFTEVGVAFSLGHGLVGTSSDDVLVDTSRAFLVLGGGSFEVSGGFFEGPGPLLDVVDGAVGVRSTVLVSEGTAVQARGGSVALVGDTVLGDLEGGARLSVSSSALDRPAVDSPTSASVVCDGAAGCFTDAAAWDFFPSPASPLRGAGRVDPASPEDWCGRHRGSPPTAGAFEGVGALSPGPLTSAFKDDISCELPDPPDHTGLPGDTGDTGDTGTAADTAEPTPEPHSGLAPPTRDTAADDPPELGPVVGVSSGCGCRTGIPAGPWPLALLALVRRRPNRTPSPE